MVEHIYAVVDKVGDPKLPAVVGFLGAFEAEAEVVGLDAGPLEKAVVLKPESALLLHAGAAF